MLIEVQSGTELAAVNADMRLPPASLTKLMTAYLVFDALKTGKISLTQKLIDIDPVAIYGDADACADVYVSLADPGRAAPA